HTRGCWAGALSDGPLGPFLGGSSGAGGLADASISPRQRKATWGPLRSRTERPVDRSEEFATSERLSKDLFRPEFLPELQHMEGTDAPAARNCDDVQIGV